MTIINNDSVNMSNSWSIPPLGFCNIPTSICDEIRSEATLLLCQKGAIVPGPAGSSIHQISNEQKPNDPFIVSADIAKKLVSCCHRCIRFKSFGVCAHVVAVSFRLEILDAIVAKINRKSANDIVKNAVNVNKKKDAGQKLNQATQKRKGPPNVKRAKIISLVDKMPINIHEMPNLPDPLPGTYFIYILKYCHKNVAVCYGCSGSFYLNGYPAVPADMVVVSKACRTYVDSSTHQKVISDKPSNVYYHFNYGCIALKDSLFSPQSMQVPDDLKPHLQAEHVATLLSCNILF